MDAEAVIGSSPGGDGGSDNVSSFAGAGELSGNPPGGVSCESGAEAYAGVGTATTPLPNGHDEEFDLDRFAEMARAAIDAEAAQKQELLTAQKQFERLPLLACGTA